MFDRGLLMRIYKKLEKLDSKKEIILVNKWVNKLNRVF